jgi:catechol 2,3-dioxygenase-like lactoylglutathione lyase family enzyme
MTVVTIFVSNMDRAVRFYTEVLAHFIHEV